MTAGAVFFDLDDTLYPYPPCLEAGTVAALETARERGYDLGREGLEALYRDGRADVKRDLDGTAAAHERYLYFKRGLENLTGTLRAGDALALGEAFWEGYLGAMELFPGVAETLETLQELGIDVAIVTNLTTHVQLRKLDRLGIEPYVDLLVTSEEVGREKPGSVMFTYPLARLGLDPSEVAMVGDSVASDVVGANAIGLESVLFNAEPAEPLTGYREPDHRIDAFEEVLEVVG